MSRAVSGRRSAIRNATSESWRISLSVSWLTPRRAYRVGEAAPRCGVRSGGDGGAIEVLVARAVLALGKRRPLARLPLAGRGAAAGDAAVESALLDLLLDERAGGVDSLRHRPGDLRLHRDREVAPNVLEERAIRLGEVLRIRCEPLHRPLARRQHLAAVLQLRRPIHIRVDEVLDRTVYRSRVLIHAVLNLEDPLIHHVARISLRFAANPVWARYKRQLRSDPVALYLVQNTVTNVFCQENEKHVARPPYPRRLA